MSVTIEKTISQAINTDLLKGGIANTLAQTGKLPPVSLAITKLGANQPSLFLDSFLNYTFSSSILIPVDTFSFGFVAPQGDPFYDQVKDGDLVNLYANDVPIATGIIDTIEVETDAESGERVNVSGRDLIGQFEDQNAISNFDSPIFSQNLSILAAVNILKTNTRLKKTIVSSDPKLSDLILSTEPGESKLSALQRLVDPLNLFFWSDANGNLIIGKPNMRQTPMGTLKLSKEDGQANNVTSIKVAYSSTQIANVMVGIWAGQELVQNRVPPEQFVENPAKGPNRLLKLNHIVSKCAVVSAPNASTAQGQAELAKFKLYGSNKLQGYAKRELAMQNHREIIVQIIVPGHYNDDGIPFAVDQTYRIIYDRGSVDEVMYLFQVEYSLDEGGQRTSLYFCRLGTLVADNDAPGSVTTAGNSLTDVSGLA